MATVTYDEDDEPFPYKIVWNSPCTFTGSSGDVIPNMISNSAGDGPLITGFGSQTSPTTWQVDNEADDGDVTDIQITGAITNATPTPKFPQDQLVT